MNLLILTQKVDINDDLLGFFHSWIVEFARHCQKVTVICLQAGSYSLPANVKVLSLGKEELGNKPRLVKKIIFLWRFYYFIFSQRKAYDFVFVHMNSEYVILGGIFWRILGKRISLWYTHKSVDFKLKVAEKLTEIIFTASKESFRLKSNKVKIVGHGIDVDRFKVPKRTEKLSFYDLNANRRSLASTEAFKIVTVGRISPIKDYETLLRAVVILTKEKKLFNIKVDIIGAPATSKDKEYKEKLKTIVQAERLENIVNFVGSVPNKNVVQYLINADLFVSTSRTGSLDKAMLEAMAVGLPVITCNQAGKAMLKNYPKLLFPCGDSITLADKIKSFMGLGQEEKGILKKQLKQIVKKNHNLDGLIKEILLIFRNNF